MLSLWLAWPRPCAGDEPKQDVVNVRLPELNVAHAAKLTAFPYAYYTPETQLAIGAGGIFTFYTSEAARLRPSKIGLSAYYSTRKQYRLSADPQLYLGNNRYFTSLYFDLGKYVDKYWGLGNDTPDLGLEDYKRFAWGILMKFQFPPWRLPVTRSGVVYEVHSDEITTKLQNPILLSDSAPGGDGGLISGLGIMSLRDTRDQLFFPNTGGFYQLELKYYFAGIGSDFNFNTLTLDLRQYRSFGPDHVLAMQAYFSYSGGNTPFYLYPAMGGQNRMRGYYLGRYRDRYYVAAQAEYRQYFWWRLGYVVFAGVGDVASDWRDFNVGDLKVSAGAGLRFIFNRAEKVNLRVDFGIGHDTNGLYFGLEEAF